MSIRSSRAGSPIIKSNGESYILSHLISISARLSVHIGNFKDPSYHRSTLEHII